MCHIHSHLQLIIKKHSRWMWKAGGEEMEEALCCNRAKTLQIYLIFQKLGIRRKTCCSLNPISQNILHNHLYIIGAQ